MAPVRRPTGPALISPRWSRVKHSQGSYYQYHINNKLIYQSRKYIRFRLFCPYQSWYSNHSFHCINLNTGNHDLGCQITRPGGRCRQSTVLKRPKTTGAELFILVFVTTCLIRISGIISSLQTQPGRVWTHVSLPTFEDQARRARIMAVLSELVLDFV